ncbi:MAG: hypothetical protein ACPGWR_01260 [Ardenticatenaceae bacterium]
MSQNQNPAVTRRHKKNFENYITEYAKQNGLDMHGPVWDAALAGAKRLDHTKERSATNESELIPAPTNFLGRVFRRLLPRREAERLSETDAIRAFLQQAPQAAAQQSEIEWGAPKNGMGTRMKARLLPGGQQKGSLPTPQKFQTLPPWDELHKRKGLDGRTLYVRGHLLHDENGGPGVDYNMTALTAALQGDFGANHANLAMRYLVEGPILGASRNMHGPKPTITDIRVEVTTDQNRQPREGTQKLGKILEAYEKAGEHLTSRLAAYGSVRQPTHQEVMDELARNPRSPHLDDAFSAVEAEPSQNWRTVYETTAANYDLWKLEDQIVAKALNITYFWFENGEATQERSRTIVIDLPNSLAALFRE